MKKQTEDYTELIDSYDADRYDVEAMRTDSENGNFSPEEAEDYRHEAIVRESIRNGQRKQAREQAQRYGLSCEEQAIEAGVNPWQ